MKQSTKRLLSSVLSLLFIVAAFIVYIELIQPVYDDVIKMRGEKAGRESLVKTQSRVLTTIQDLLVSYDSAAQNRDKIARMLPQSADLADLIVQLNGAATENGVAPLTYTTSLSSALSTIGENTNGGLGRSGLSSFVKPVGTVNVQYRATGTYENFKKFLATVETNVRLMNVKSLTIAPLGKQNENLYSYDGTISGYYQNAR